MADTKIQAMNKAKDAALDSVSFVLSATKAQSMELKKSSLLAARNVVAVRKNLITLVNTFTTYRKTIKQIQGIVGKKGDANSKVSQISSILQSGGDAYKQKEAEQEEKPKATELVKGIGKNLSGVAGTALALAIPFLLSPEMREMLMGFFQGFIEGLGLGKEALANLKTGLLVTAGILAAVFGAKQIANIATAFQQMKQLAQVLGLAGETVDAENTKQDLEKKKLEEGTKKAKKEVKDGRKEIRKGKKLSFLKKLPFLLNTVAPKLTRMMGNILKAIPFVGTFIGLAMVAYDLFDIGKDINDLFFGKDDATSDAEEEQETTQEDTASVAATAQPSTAPVAMAEAESKASTSNTTPQDITTNTPPPMEAEPAPSSSSSGATIIESSVKVERADSALAQEAGGLNVISVNNSTTIFSNDKTSIQASPSLYSMTVGA